MKPIHWLAGIFTAFCLMIILLITSVEAVVYWTPGYFEREYTKYNVLDSLPSMTMEDLLEVTDEMMDYLKGEREDLHVVTVMDGQEREFFHRQHRITAQNHVAAVVVLMKNGADVLARGIGGCIHMGNQTQGGLILTTGCGGDGAVNIAVFIYAGVGNAHLVQFLHQQLRQVQLAGRRGKRLALGI